MDRGQRLGRAAVLRLGTELREARVDRGLSIDEVAAALGISNAEVSRIERGLSPNVPLVTLARFAAVVGLDLVAKLYPGATPVRDAPQQALLADFRMLLHHSLRWDVEVPLPIARDQRAWDGFIRGTDWRFGVEGESAPRDGQGLVRRLQLKQRDGSVDGVLLVVPDTRTVRHFLEAAGESLRPMFPVSSRAARAALRAGRRPPGNAIVVIPGRRRARATSS